MSTVPMLDLAREYRHMQADVDAAIRRCLEHQKWIFGPEVGALERAAADHLGSPHAVGVSSGTEALVLALRALAISRRGTEYWNREDLVLTTPFTFTATGDAILRAGATPLFVDVDPVSFNLDPALVAECLASPLGKRVVGLIPVHLYGRPCRMDALLDLAREHGLFVVEDVAQAFGGRWGDRALGALGDAGAFSFFPSKNLGGFGDGGLVATGDAALADLVRVLLKHGGRDKYNVEHVGYNARLDTLQAAVVLAKLGHLDDFNRRRRAVAERYSRGLAGIDGLAVPEPGSAPGAENAGHVFHQYTLRTGRRDALQAHLKEHGVATMVYYPVPLHRMRVFEGRCEVFGRPAHAERAVEQVLSLPIEPLLTDGEIAQVIGAVRGFFGA